MDSQLVSEPEMATMTGGLLLNTAPDSRLNDIIA